jgi:hypothetical protein
MTVNKKVIEKMDNIHIKVPASLKEEVMACADKRLVSVSTLLRTWINDILEGKGVKIDDGRPNKRAS